MKCLSLELRIGLFLIAAVLCIWIGLVGEFYSLHLTDPGPPPVLPSFVARSAVFTGCEPMISQFITSPWYLVDLNGSIIAGKVGCFCDCAWPDEVRSLEGAQNCPCSNTLHVWSYTFVLKSNPCQDKTCT